MAHHKNRKPKPFKGCCPMCSMRCTNGTRCGRVLTMQERRAQRDALEAADVDLAEMRGLGRLEQADADAWYEQLVWGDP